MYICKIRPIVSALLISAIATGCNNSAPNTGGITPLSPQIQGFGGKIKSLRIGEHPAKSYLEIHHDEQRNREDYERKKSELVTQHYEPVAERLQGVTDLIAKIPIGIIGAHSAGKLDLLGNTEYGGNLNQFIIEKNIDFSRGNLPRSFDGKLIDLGDADVVAISYKDNANMRRIAINANLDYANNDNNRLELYYQIGRSFFSNLAEKYNYSQITQDFVDLLYTLRSTSGDSDLIRAMIYRGNGAFDEIFAALDAGRLDLNSLLNNVEPANNLLASIFANYQNSGPETFNKLWPEGAAFMLEKMDIGQKIDYKTQYPEPRNVEMPHDVRDKLNQGALKLYEYLERNYHVGIKVQKTGSYFEIGDVIPTMIKDLPLRFGYASIGDSGHQESLIKDTDEAIINVVPFATDDEMPLTIAVADAQVAYYTSQVAKIIVGALEKNIVPQTTFVHCRDLGTLYHLNLLENQAAQFNEYTLKLNIKNKDKWSEVEKLKNFFVPSPQVLKYSQSSLYNKVIEAFVISGEPIVDLEHRGKKYTVKPIMELIKSGKISNINQQDFLKFQEKWRSKYDQVKKDREFMNNKNEINQYLEFEAYRFEQLIKKLSSTDNQPSV